MPPDYHKVEHPIDTREPLSPASRSEYRRHSRLPAPASDVGVRVLIVIPAYNEASVIQSVVSAIRQEGFSTIIVVDDGSSDTTGWLAQKAGAILVRHALNRGKGAATTTGIEAALRLGATSIVTFDGDGQHNPADIHQLIAAIKDQNVDISLGVRRLTPDVMPWSKIMANRTANFLTWLCYGLWVSDSQCGLRAFTRRAAELIDTQFDAYEYESEVIREIRHHRLRYREVTVTTLYPMYAQTKPDRQTFPTGFLTAYRLVRSLFR